MKSESCFIYQIYLDLYYWANFNELMITYQYTYFYMNEFIRISIKTEQSGTYLYIVKLIV